MSTTCSILTDEAIGTISPRLHGHFAEHLGRCCYDGLWGADGAVRSAVVDALKRIGVPLLRWPGGCFADLYHWRDGIGPLDSRPRRYAESCGERLVDNNRVGTHEFVELCRAIGAEAYLAGNVGSGTVAELCEWIAYCNDSFDTALASERAQNGHSGSMGVKLWGVGNESWGCGGNFDPVHYAHEYRRFATMMRRVDPSIELVIVGDNRTNVGWNAAVLGPLKRHPGLVQHLSVHRYWHAGPALSEDPDDYLRLLHGAEQVRADIDDAAQTIEEVFGSRGAVKIAFDEWGVWHPEARVNVQYGASSTWRDALAAAATLDVFASRCDVVSMANLAQIVNVLQPLVQTHGDEVRVTPTGEVFALYAPHRGATALKIALESCPEQSVPAYPSADVDWRALPPLGSLPWLGASASRAADGAINVTLTNRHQTEPLEVTMKGIAAKNATVRRVHADNLAALSARTADETLADASTIVLPPASVTNVTVPTH